MCDRVACACISQSLAHGCTCGWTANVYELTCCELQLQVIADDSLGLLFKNKRDRKVMNVDPCSNPGDNSTRTQLATDEYLQVVLYDHVTRRRS